MTTDRNPLPELARLVNLWEERIANVNKSLAQSNDTSRWYLERTVLRNISTEMHQFVASINSLVASNNDAKSNNTQRNVDEDGREVFNCRRYRHWHHRHVWGGNPIEYRCEGAPFTTNPPMVPEEV